MTNVQEAVVPKIAGYLKPEDEWAVSPFFVRASERTQPWMREVFTIPVYDAPPSGSWESAVDAPRDGSDVLLWLRAPYNRKALARWYAPWGVWIEGDLPKTADPNSERYGIGSEVPSHWLRTPGAPEETAA
jgi:hypothetical protein